MKETNLQIRLVRRYKAKRNNVVPILHTRNTLWRVYACAQLSRKQFFERRSDQVQLTDRLSNVAFKEFREIRSSGANFILQLQLCFEILVHYSIPIAACPVQLEPLER